MPRLFTTPRPYSYTIPKVQLPSPEILKKLKPWNIQEFIRVEALLRSRTLMNLYDSVGTDFESNFLLAMVYGVEWSVLEGAHHRYLLTIEKDRPHPYPLTIGTVGDLFGIFDRLAKSLEKLPDLGREPVASMLGLLLREKVFYVLAHPSCDPEGILAYLRPALYQGYRGIGKRRVFRLKEWLKYFECYDRQVAHGQPYAEIAKDVYKASKKKGHDLVNKACRKVRRVIKAAEQNAWPPSGKL